MLISNPTLSDASFENQVHLDFLSVFKFDLAITFLIKRWSQMLINTSLFASTGGSSPYLEISFVFQQPLLLINRIVLNTKDSPLKALLVNIYQHLYNKSTARQYHVHSLVANFLL